MKLVGQKSTKKESLYKIFIYGMVEFFCFSLYFIVSGLEGNFNWTVEQLTSTAAGMAIQTIMLIATIFGFIVAIQIIVYILLNVTHSD
ncbi:MAG: hypothetical protein KGD74_11805 [Candidatus Lokiarchaeota archaeon]|nr:hypothetical protein [Candidatus Lokiarchaeota archaeon]